MTIVDLLSNLCHPVSEFWWTNGTTSCTFNQTPAANTSCHDEVDFSLCFEDTAILFGICVIFWVLAGLTFCRGFGIKPSLNFGPLHAIKLILLLIPFLTGICDFIYTLYQEAKEDVAKFQYLVPIAITASMLVSASVIYRDRLRGHRSSGLMLLFWLGLVIYGSLKLRTYILTARDQYGIEDKFRFSTFCLQYAVYLLQFVLSVIPEPKKKRVDYSILTERKPSPEEDAHFLSRITWWWQNKQIWNGWRRPIRYSDLTDLNSMDKSQEVAAYFQRNWERELNKAGINFGHKKSAKDDEMERNSYSHDEYNHSSDKISLFQDAPDHQVQHRGWKKSRKPSLFMALVRSFGGDFAVTGALKFFQDLLNFVSPLLLKLIIQFTGDELQPDWHGYVFAVLLFTTGSVQSLILNQYFYRAYIIGMRIRTAVVAAVYNKALRLSNKTRRTKTTGEIVNLMSVDAQRFKDLMPTLHMIWSAPLQIILSLIFLYLTMGPSIFAGFAILVLMIPFNSCLVSWTKRIQAKQMAQKDSRIKIINEVFNGIKIIKLYAWELPFQRLISGTRVREVHELKKAAYLNAFTSFAWNSVPFTVALVTFATYSLVNLNNPNERLTADKAFVALSLFNVLRFPLATLPTLISSLAQASVSVKRLSTFLRSEELDPNIVDWNPGPASDGEAAVSMTDGSFSWDGAKRATIQKLNLSVKPGQLVAVVGQVGAGKSSLIQALLGEMEKHGGHVALQGSVAYVPQQAWIQNATLKENILFGKELNNMRYGKTLEACALVPDLDILPGRDMVEIGEKGINLSGGQKQRVSLARAVYQDSDIYLLDDPLSAVDSHVGKHIFDKVLGPQGMLKNKVRLLVTHGIGFLPQCDVIVVMADGQITEVGSYNELIDNDGAFAQFLQTYKGVEESNEEEESDSAAKVVSRQSSTVANNMQKTEKDDSKKADKNNERSTLISKEKVQTDRVTLAVIAAYCRACTWYMTILVLFFTVMSHAVSVATNFWLAEWSSAESDSPNTTATLCDITNSPSGCYLGIYALFSAGQIVSVLVASFTLAIAGVSASHSLHSRMLKNILRSPMSFFDTTPLGRVLNRFSKDIYLVDEVVPKSIRTFFFTGLRIFSAILVIVIATPTFAIVILPLSIFYSLVQRFYVATSRQLKRLESVTRSPIYSHFQESLLGASSIRAYRQQDRFMKESERRVDYNQMAYYPSICANRWLSVRLEFLGNLIIFFAALFAAIQRNYGEQLNLRISPGLVGLSISYALQITQCLSCVVRMASDLETNIVAVERIKEYSETPTEAPPIIESNRPPDDWPSQGHIKFDHYSTRYREGLDLVLKNITVDILGGTKVGIVGRTGAGKSSLTLSMFRIIEAAGGAILIDNNNIADYGLDDLRAKITIIPQDPVLFSGTLRMNIDPFESYSDSDLWRVLESAHLKTFVSGLEKKLQHHIAEGGENLSVGQRQLVCLARALLRKTKILVLDEATAAVDLETDDLIQKTIRSEFRECTVITIAHRLNTIMDYDKIVVLDNGRIAEYDSPGDLVADRKSIFFSMAKNAGLAA